MKRIDRSGNRLLAKKVNGSGRCGDTTGSTAPLWAALHSRQLYEMGPIGIYFSYPLLRWTGLMLVGFGASSLFELPEKVRNARLVRIGLTPIIAFILIRALNVYGDPHPWDFDPSSITASVMSFLGTTKYPPSLAFILMTLGPAAIACAFSIASTLRSEMH